MNLKRYSLKNVGALLLVLCLVTLVGCSSSFPSGADSLASAALSQSSTLTPTPTPSPSPTPIPFDLSTIPAYSGSPYVSVNGGQPNFTEEEKNAEAFETYSPLDSLGRCGIAFANICTELMPTEERGDIGMVKPAGWHIQRYDDLVEGKYLYNRCHLIGYQLAGENDNVENLITGTRYLNVEGMLPLENQVAQYVQSTGHHVLYQVTPIYEGDNLLANGLLMEAYSVEDDGAGVCFCNYVYNVQPYIEIDYATGDSSISVNAPSPTPEPTANLTPEPEQEKKQNGIEADYIANTNTGKFHYPYCSSVNNMKESNKLPFTGSRDELITQGYVSCKKCNP